MALALEVPALAGSRRRAQQLLSRLPDDLTGQKVHLYCNSLLAAAASFADELIKVVLVDRNAAGVEVSNLSDREFAGYLRTQAQVHGVSDRIRFEQG